MADLEVVKDAKAEELAKANERVKALDEWVTVLEAQAEEWKAYRDAAKAFAALEKARAWADEKAKEKADADEMAREAAYALAKAEALVTVEEAALEELAAAWEWL